jgi:hypothetical protein
VHEGLMDIVDFEFAAFVLVIVVALSLVDVVFG